jgi:hypothetical protein
MALLEGLLQPCQRPQRNGVSQAPGFRTRPGDDLTSHRLIMSMRASGARGIGYAHEALPVKAVDLGADPDG